MVQTIQDRMSLHANTKSRELMYRMSVEEMSESSQAYGRWL